MTLLLRAARGAARRYASSVQLSFEGPKPLATGRMQGKTAIVTGGGQGIGEAVCRALASEGASVVVADISEGKARAVAASIPGGIAAGVDVTQSEAVSCLICEAAKALGGRVDAVVNNAGIVPSQVLTHEYPLEEWRRVLDVNLNGAFYVLRESLAQMMAQGPRGGVVLNMTSTAAHTGMPNIAPYTAAKTALLGLTKSTAAEYAPYGIRICALSPSATGTDMLKEYVRQNPEIGEKVKETVPLHGFVEPLAIGQAAAFLCSGEAHWISGSALKVDAALLASCWHPKQSP